MITSDPLIASLLPLSYADTINLCQTSQSMHQLCQTEKFWETKAAAKYGEPLPLAKTPAQRYHELELKRLEYLPLVTEKQIELLNFLLYHRMTQGTIDDEDFDEVVEIINNNLSDDPHFYQNVSPSNDVNTIIDALVELANKPLINLAFLVLKAKYGPVLNNPYQRMVDIDQQLLLINQTHVGYQKIAIKPIEIINKSLQFNLGYNIDFVQGGYTNGIPTLELYTDPSIGPLSYQTY